MRDLSNEIVEQFNKNGISYLQFRELSKLGIKHAYILKCDGFEFKYRGRTAKKEEIEKAYKPVCEMLDLEYDNLILPIQRHTDNIRYIDKIYERFLLGGVDGLVTNKKDLVLATTNADCILYLLYDKRKKVIGNIHSGWRGSYQRIIEKAVDKMINEFNCSPEDIIVCVCPSIRKCCFEVDKDVKDMFYEKFSFLENIDNFILNGYKPGKYFIDTVGINKCLLKNKGIDRENIYDSNICSLCNNDLIHSYRGEGAEYSLCTAIISL